MMYTRIENESFTNGPGIRVVVWCQGCSIHCQGCHNKETWDSNKGKVFTCNDGYEVLEKLRAPHISGLTLSGGHPLEPYNIEMCEQLCREVKSNIPDKTIWLYTGWLMEDIMHLPIMKYVDVVVDGPYMEKLRDVTLPYRGSSNQRVIDVQKTLRKKKIVEYEIKSS